MGLGSISAVARRSGGLLLALLGLLVAGTGWAHEVRPAVVDLTITEQARYQLAIRLNLEAIIAEIGPEHGDTADSPNAGRYDALRALSPAQLAQAFEPHKRRFLDSLQLQSPRGALSPVFEDVAIPSVGDIELSRDSVVTLTGRIPAGADPLTWQWAEHLGPVILRVTGPDQTPLYQAYLQAGRASAPIALAEAVQQPIAALFADYLAIGFEHIIPKGLDHILFVVGLFLFSLHWRPLLWQVTSFTLAHSVTLALGMLGYVSVSPAIVEPLIALSIVYVCVENLLSQRLHAWRPMIIFAFGLLHGLGFAGVLAEVGLSSADFLTGLVAFNLGIELGQLAVILSCFLLVGVWFRHKAWYRQRIVMPASGVIALIGGYWFVERTFL